jgi:hypothetical protein
MLPWSIFSFAKDSCRNKFLQAHRQHPFWQSEVVDEIAKAADSGEAIPHDEESPPLPKQFQHPRDGTILRLIVST